MKICVGYYDKDGEYIGEKLDDPSREKFVVIMGNLVKKIAEHDNQSPYKNHRVDGWTKTYCDKNRIVLYADIYINGKLSNTITNANDWYYWRHDKNKPLHKLITKIFKHVKETKRTNLIEKYKLEDEKTVYFPIHI